MKRPDFFIVGAPKSGTTAMQNYLSQHPEIFMPRVKELHFFGRDLKFGSTRRVLSEEQYLHYFKDAKNEKRVGEASVWYLYSRRAAYEIKEFNPSAQIIIMLRNPVDVLYSLHSRSLYNGREDISDFKAALEAEGDRKRGISIPRSVILIDALYYRETVRFSEQVQRYYDVFGRENVLILTFDDFIAETAKVFKDSLFFLGVSEDFQPSFSIINPNKVVRSKFVRDYLLINPPKALLFARNLVPHGLRKGIIEMLNRYNTKYKQREPMDPELRKRLLAEFASEAEKLSKLLGRDLTHWAR